MPGSFSSRTVVVFQGLLRGRRQRLAGRLQVDGGRRARWRQRQPCPASGPPATPINHLFSANRRHLASAASWSEASGLLDTYVGHDAGERILAGHIRRGDIEEIHAAIWLSDMRGFTALADSLPPRVMIDLLNRYFDCQVPVILNHGAKF